MLNASQRRVNKNSLTWWYVLKTSWRYLCKTSWRCLEDVFKTSWSRLEDVLKTFLQDDLKTSWKRVEDVLARRLEDVWKTCGQGEYIGLDQDVFWRRNGKANIFLLIKTSSSRRMFAGMLPLALLFIYRHGYSFSSDKKWLFSERLFLCLGKRVQSKNKQMFHQIFS